MPHSDTHTSVAIKQAIYKDPKINDRDDPMF